jgi:hypothetical protein
MNNIYKYLVIITIFFLGVIPTYACIDSELLSPDPSYLNEENLYTGYGHIINGTSIGWEYGLQPNERMFSVDIAGWSCANGLCTGDSYTGSYTMSIYVTADSDWVGRLYTNVEGACPLGWQHMIERPVTTPKYVMSASTSASVTGLLGSLVSVVLRIIPIAIAIVGGLVVTLFGLRKLIYFVRYHRW